MAPRTRDRLVVAAASLLDVGGVDAVTLREVGRRSGVSHNAPYKHFVDKSALLAAVAAEELRTLTRRLRAADGPRGAARVYVDWALEHPARFTLTFGRWDRDDEALAAAAAAARSAFIDRVEPGAAGGEEPVATAMLLWTLAHGAVALHLGGHLDKDGTGLRPHDVVEDLLALLVP